MSRDSSSSSWVASDSSTEPYCVMRCSSWDCMLRLGLLLLYSTVLATMLAACSGVISALRSGCVVCPFPTGLRIEICCYLAVSCSAAALAFWLSWRPGFQTRSKHIMSAAGFVLVNGAFALNQALLLTALYMQLPWLYGITLGVLLQFAVQIWLEALIVYKVCALTASSGGPFSQVAFWLQRLLCAQTVVWVFNSVGQVHKHYLDTWIGSEALQRFACFLHHILFIAVMSGSLGVLVAVLRHLQQSSRAAHATTPRPLEAMTSLKMAKKAVWKQFIGAGASFSMAVVQISLFWFNDIMLHYPGLLGFVADPLVVWGLMQAANILETFFNIVCAVILSGGHRVSGVTPKKKSVATQVARRGRFIFSRAATHDRLHMDADWFEKVKDLAQRGITVSQLLQFYNKLGNDIMPHFEPKVHTTHDVVRQAVIPMTSSRRCAYAEVSSSKPLLPDKMVTHNWGNLFRDLVSAVVADALGECTFAVVAKLLDSDRDMLEHMLSESGRMFDVYWICAFSVNQHSGICSSCPAWLVDSLLGTPQPICDCGLRKVFNYDAPLSSDGRSILCEMNKFDDMMQYLAIVKPNFEQVVAVDANCVLFTRAWCVAELAKASEWKLPQHIQLRSGKDVQQHEDSLRHLRVEHMQASRPEDVQEILAKIPDKEAFNASLQKLIFDNSSGLLAEWRRLHAGLHMREAGRLIRWGRVDSVLARQGSVWQYWCTD